MILAGMPGWQIALIALAAALAAATVAVLLDRARVLGLVFHTCLRLAAVVRRLGSSIWQQSRRAPSILQLTVEVGR